MLVDKMPQPNVDESDNECDVAEMSQEPVTERCIHYEKHICNGRDCTDQHGSLPYLWRLRRGDAWMNLDNSQDIERAFSDARSIACIFDLGVRTVE
jgi:hypothetical protein